jgi:hypothetical protein
MRGGWDRVVLLGLPTARLSVPDLTPCLPYLYRRCSLELGKGKRDMYME